MFASQIIVIIGGILTKCVFFLIRKVSFVLKPGYPEEKNSVENNVEQFAEVFHGNHLFLSFRLRLPYSLILPSPHHGVVDGGDLLGHAEKRNRQRWAAQVDKLHEELELYDSLLNSLHISPMSWIWTWCMNGKQMAEYRLDCLCGIYN